MSIVIQLNEIYLRFQDVKIRFSISLLFLFLQWIAKSAIDLLNSVDDES